MTVTGTHPEDSRAAPAIRAQHMLACAAIIGLFAIWGLAQWLYAVLFPKFAEFFALNPAQTTSTQSLFNVAYCVLAVPAVMTQRKFGYKLGIIFALSLFSLGSFLLYPAIVQQGFPFFLGAIVLMGASWAWLETTINPLIVEMGPRETAVRRLNLAQAFYPVGLVAGTYAALWLIHSNYRLSVGDLAPVIAHPYVWVGLGVLLLAFLIENIDFPAAATARADKGAKAGSEFRDLLSRPVFRLGAAALFCNVVAQSVTWGSTFNYVMQEIPNATAVLAGGMITWSCIVLGVGRFTGTLAMRWIDPAPLLAWYAGVSLVLIVPAMIFGGLAGLVCLVAVSFFMSIFYPTIFGSTIRDLGALTKAGSGLLVTAAGLAAALAPFIMVAALAAMSARVALVLALPCFVIVLIAALRWTRQEVRPASVSV